MSDRRLADFEANHPHGFLGHRLHYLFGEIKNQVEAVFCDCSTFIWVDASAPILYTDTEVARLMVAMRDAVRSRPNAIVTTVLEDGKTVGVKFGW